MQSLADAWYTSQSDKAERNTESVKQPTMLKFQKRENYQSQLLRLCCGALCSCALVLCLLEAQIPRRTPAFVLMVTEKHEVQQSNSSMKKCPATPEDHSGIYIYFQTI